MYVVHDMPPQIDPALIDRLRQVETGTVGHMRHHGFMSPGLHAVGPGIRTAGTAVTVMAPVIDSAVLHYAMGLLRPGDFLVIDRCGDRRHACWGGITAMVAKTIGLAGVVVDGPATDVEELRASGVPVWCRGFSPVTTKSSSLGGQLNVPVSCGGVAVLPGDAILADQSGIVVLRPAEVASVADEGAEIQQREIEIVKRVQAGESLWAISTAAQRVREAVGRR